MEEGVPRLVYLSSLSQVNRYDAALAVTEQWRPKPSSSKSDLCFHLGEFVCREFAREAGLRWYACEWEESYMVLRIWRPEAIQLCTLTTR